MPLEGLLTTTQTGFNRNIERVLLLYYRHSLTHSIPLLTLSGTTSKQRKSELKLVEIVLDFHRYYPTYIIFWDKIVVGIYRISSPV